MSSPDAREITRLAPETVTATARPVGRLPLAFGPRFFVLLLIGLVWTGPAWFDHRFVWAMLSWDGLVMLSWFVDLRRLPNPGAIEVAREWSGPLSIGETTNVMLRVRCVTPLTLRLGLRDDLAPPLESALEAAHGSQYLWVRSGEAARLMYTIRPGSRGDYRVGAVYLRYQSPLRLAERQASAGLQQIVRVYPNLRQSQQFALYLIRSRQVELEKRLKRQSGVGREFESLRDYRAGDDGRDICWTATARRAKLITRTYRVERSQPVVLVVDAGRLLLSRVRSIPDSGLPAIYPPPPGDPPGAPESARVNDSPQEQIKSQSQNAKGGLVLTKLDYSVDAALSLVRVALISGDAVGLTAYSSALQVRLPVARGASHLRAIVESLTDVRGELAEADHERAASHLLATQKRRSLVVWLTDLAETAATPAVIEAASRLLRRHLVLFVAIGQPELCRLVASKPGAVHQAYRYVAALEMAERRDLLLRRLRRQGALTFELQPEELSVGLVNRYLEIKERGLL